MESSTCLNGRRYTVDIILIFQGVKIIDLKSLNLVGTHITPVLAGINAYGVGTYGTDIIGHLLTCAVTEGNHADNSHDTDNDAEHCQQSSHSVSDHSNPGHFEGFLETKECRSETADQILFKDVTVQFLPVSLRGVCFLLFGSFGNIGNNVAVSDFDNTVRMRRYARIMGYQDYGMSVGMQFLENSQHFLSALGIKGTGRFIGQNNLSAVHQGAGD